MSAWHRVEDGDVPDDGRVRSVDVDGRSVAHGPALLCVRQDAQLL